MKSNEILKIYGTDYKRMTKELLEEADLAARIPSKDCTVGIKPNLVSPTDASYGATTHPEVVEGILEYLRERGYQNLLILEGSWVGDRTEEAFEVLGYNRLAGEFGAEICDTQKDRYSLVDCKGMELQICDSVRRLDFLINVPVLKGHCQTKLTCALKNMKGLIPNQEKRRFHALGLHKPIAHLNVGIRQDFIVVDHICGDLDFEDGGNPVIRNCLMAAVDPVLVDAYALSLLHYGAGEVPYITLSEALGVGCADLTKARVRVVGQETEKPPLPKSRKVVELQDAVEEVESCSACYGYLLPALEMLRQEGVFQKLDTKICIGQGYRGKEGKLGIGNCTRKFQHSLSGCPPTEEEIYKFLKAYLMKKEY